jgi:uncharacterized membrane protein YcaP (DUF421 family)
MKKEEIHLDDWRRILFGQAPAEFLLEALMRTLIIYVAMLIVLRLLGKRMNGQITITELAVIITLGAIVALPMQVPDRGILPGIVLLVVVMLLQRGVTGWGVRNPRVEKIIQGEMSLLVRDGVLQLNALKDARILRDQLFAQLRDKAIEHLGQVERVYLEGCGVFSVFRREQPVPGLSVLPTLDAAAAARRRQ